MDESSTPSGETSHSVVARSDLATVYDALVADIEILARTSPDSEKTRELRAVAIMGQDLLRRHPPPSDAAGIRLEQQPDVTRASNITSFACAVVDRVKQYLTLVEAADRHDRER